MKVTIDEAICAKLHLSVAEVLMILLVKTGVDIPELVTSMKEKQMLVEENSLLGKKILVTQRWSEQCDRALLRAEKDIPQGNALEALAKSLMNVFPAGKKEGTCHYWRGNTREVTLRLSKFFKLYGNKYTDEQIIDAAQRYVSSFNGRYQYMRVLKYFLWKEDKKMDAEGNTYVVEVSDLAAFIENAGQENKLREDWMSTMV